MSNPHIVLYEPMYWDAARDVQRAPLSLLHIAGLLDQENYKVSIISRRLFDNVEEKIIEDCKEAICFGVTSLTGYQIIDGIKMSQLIKKKYPHIPVVWGGWHPSLEPETTLQNHYIDIIVRGQGERTFYELVKALEHKKPLEGVAGLSFKKNGRLFHNPDRLLEDLNNFPPVPYHLIDIERVLSNDEYGQRVLNYVSSYGCPHRCAFCAEWKVHHNRWTAFSPQRMVKDFQRLRRAYGIDCIAINDTQFFLDKRRVQDFCENLLRSEVGIHWDNVQGNIRQLLNYEDSLWELMVDAGLKSLLVGAESGWPEALKLVNKNLTVEETLQFAEKAQNFDIKVLYSFILGLPWNRDYKKTHLFIDKEVTINMKLSDKLIRLNDKNRILFCVYTPYPGNPLYEKACQIGLKPPHNLEEWGNWTLGRKSAPWISLSQTHFINFISTYIFLFLDSTSYGWVTARLKNRFLRNIFQLIFKFHIRIAQFRWKHKFFKFPIDYWIYLLGRKVLKIA